MNYIEKKLREELFNKTADLETAEAKVKALEADYGRLQNDNQKYIDNRIAAEAKLDAVRNLSEKAIPTFYKENQVAYAHGWNDMINKIKKMTNELNEALGENDEQ